jgi:hypothetical protein
MILRSGNPGQLTAWSYAVSSMLLSCTVLRTSNQYSLVVWSYAMVIHVSWPHGLALQHLEFLASHSSTSYNL